MYYAVEKETGKFITSFINGGDYELKGNETIVTTEWANGLYGPTYGFKNNCWKNGMSEEEIQQLIEQGELQGLRNERQAKCFPIINRGQPWYDKLTEEQKTELNTWYQAWLDVTETMAAPKKPEWI